MLLLLRPSQKVNKISRNFFLDVFFLEWVGEIPVPYSTQAADLDSTALRAGIINSCWRRRPPAEG